MFFNTDGSLCRIFAIRGSGFDYLIHRHKSDVFQAGEGPWFHRGSISGAPLDFADLTEIPDEHDYHRRVAEELASIEYA